MHWFDREEEDFHVELYVVLNRNPRNKDSVLDSKFFTGEFRADTSYIYDYNHPIDHSLGGTTEGARTGEFQVQHLGVGGDFHAGNMQENPHTVRYLVHSDAAQRCQPLYWTVEI